MNTNRTPSIGDMLIVKSDSSNIIGIIHNIMLDKWGHQKNVWVQWADARPSNYNPIHGYSGMNIHNLRSEFDIVRNGISIK